MNELQNWWQKWQDLAPETRTNVQNGAAALGALLIGHIVGGMVARSLRARNFDGLFRLPTSSAPGGGDPSRGFTPAWMAGVLVRLTIWAGAAWWLAGRYDRADIADKVLPIIKQVWSIVGLLAAALIVASLLTRRLMDCFQGMSPAGIATSRNGTTPGRGIAGAVGAGVYGLVVLLTLLVSADYFNWPITRTAAVALWQLAQQLLVAGAALAIGIVGGRMAREVASPSTAMSPEQRAAQRTALGIVAGTTALAVALLLFSSGGGSSLTILLFVGAIGGAAWLARGHLPDVIAGLRLRTDKVCQVWSNGAWWQVGKIGLLTAEVGRGGEYTRMQNRIILEAVAQSPQEAPAPAAAAHAAAGHGRRSATW